MGGSRLVDRAGDEAGLVERADALATLQRLLDDTGTGRCGVVVLRAPAGMGKSSLLAVGCDVAARSGLRVLRARGLDLEAAVAYGALAQLLTPVLRELDAAARDAAFLGPLGAIAAPRPVPLAPDPDMAHAVHVAAAELLAAAAQRQPLLLALDDAQWADEATLRALTALLARLSDAPVGLLLAARDEPGPRSTAIDAICADPRCLVQALRPLSADGVAAVVAAHTAVPLDASTLAACTEVTAGTPFFAVALAQELDGHRSPSAPMVHALTPAAVRRSVGLRIGALGPAAAAAVRALAVLDDGAPLRRLRRLADLDAAVCVEAVEALVGAGIVRLEPGDRLAFVHPIVAAGVREDLGPARAAAAHGRAAELLRADGERPARIAAHLLRSPAGEDPHAAADLLAAGEDALARGAPAEAITVLERALREPPPGALRCPVLLTLGGAELLGGQATSAAGHLRAALEAATDPGAAVAAVVALVTALNATGEHAQAAAVCRDAAERGLPPALLLELDAHVALTARSVVATTDLALESVARLRAARDPGALVSLALAMNLIAMLDDGDDPVQDAIALARAALAHPAPLTAPELLIGHLSVLVMALGERFDEAAEALVDYERRVAVAGSRSGIVAAAQVRTRIELARGDIVRAREAGTFTRETGMELGWSVGLTLASGWLAAAEIEAGEPDLAAATLAHPAASAMPAGSGQLLVPEIVRARLRRHRGDPAGALERLLRVGAGAEEWRWHNVGEMPWRSEAALCLHELDRSTEALALVDEEIAVARAAGLPAALGRALTRRAVVTGDGAGLEEATELLRGADARVELARTLTVRGRRALEDGDLEGGRGQLREALDLSAAGGAALVASRARAALVASGARPRRAAVSGLASLTERERRVATLAAEGRSNREIAEAEFCTVKTVEVHLTNAYRKLGVPGRAQLPDALADG
ncbi:AAA family ATPase [Conexibacter sp. W3-3-2]|uniref:helix-turn-helix transcriptional regulator n=1 Tax=Conexibacter sp. W3-3-2 TaxID=2675227 RepID=UPI0012B98A5F|nr:LuxR family transcriptional regulator [Conexibacter sp. W3-3-2]MTD46755.1 AAA family ATPase [Conexibacter sp. W3-3-2]